MRQLYVQLLFYQVKAIHNIITIGIWYVTSRVRQRSKIELDNELVKLTIMQADVFFSSCSMIGASQCLFSSINARVITALALWVSDLQRTFEARTRQGNDHCGCGCVGGNSGSIDKT